MTPIAAFADEISPDLTAALAILREHNIQTVDIRSVDDINVLDLTDQRIDGIAHELTAADITVGAVASPIGKTSIEVPHRDELHRFDRALTIARRLSARYIRVFSYYGPHHGWNSHQTRQLWLPEVTRRLADMDSRANAAGVTLLIENERDTYADLPEHMVALLDSIGSDTLRTAFDPANYLLCQTQPYPDAYEILHRWIGCVHVKDIDEHGTAVPAGAGRSRWPELIDRLNTDHPDVCLSLEPHLAIAGPAGGFTGIDRFATAVTALTRLLPASRTTGE